MTTAVITKDSLERQAWDNIFAVMNNRSNIADPRGSSAEQRQFILDSDPFSKSLDFTGVPYIILELPTLEYARNSLDGKHKFITWKHNITVRAARNGSSGSRTDTGRADILNIGDDMQSTFNSRAIRDDLKVLNISMVKLSKTSNNTVVIAQEEVYEARYDLEYLHRIQVSA